MYSYIRVQIRALHTRTRRHRSKACVDVRWHHVCLYPGAFYDAHSITSHGCTCDAQYNNLYLLSVTKRNSNVALMVIFLYRLVNVRSCALHSGKVNVSARRCLKITLESWRKKAYETISSSSTNCWMRLWISAIHRPVNPAF
jgi:hypothetical protein